MNAACANCDTDYFAREALGWADVLRRFMGWDGVGRRDKRGRERQGQQRDMRQFFVQDT